MTIEKVKHRFALLMEKQLSSESIGIPLSALSEKEQKDYWRRRKEFHPSSAPICPLRLAHENFVLPDDPTVYFSFAQSYYLSVGTMMHELVQKWLGLSGKIVGNWTCISCSPKVAYRFCISPKTCRKCGGSVFEYHELGGKDDGVAWHCDGVFKLGGEYYVIDYKTTSAYQIEQHRKEGGVFPYYSNLFQLETYIPLLEQKYQIKIAGWMLVYISRDKPNNIKYGVEVVGEDITEVKRERLEARLERFKKAYSLALKVRESPVKIFKRAIETKLCPDRETYQEKIRGFAPCYFEDVCWSKTKLNKTIKEILDAGPGVGFEEQS